jgi:hypothetical protein
MRQERNDNLQQTIAFRNEHHRLPIKTARASSEERRLAHWRHHNASLLDRGLLDERRAHAFRNAGFLVNHSEQAWNRMLDRTVRFIQMCGRFPSRNGASKEERECGRWRTDQNGFLKRGVLSPQRSKRFIDAGVAGTIYDQNWRRYVKQVVLFRKKHGHLPRTSGDIPGEAALGIWCTKNRGLLKRKKLAATRRTILNASKVTDTSELKSRWQASYKRFHDFCTVNNRLPGYDSKDEELVVYRWYRVQLSHISNGKLNRERQIKIEHLRKTFRSPKLTDDEKWRTMYQRVNVFISRHKHLPRAHKRSGPEFQLCTWILRQKLLYRSDLLSSEQQRMLKRLHASMFDLDEWSTPIKEKRMDQWDRKYCMAKEIIEKTGLYPSQVSHDRTERRLSSWFLRERKKVESKVLDLKRAEKLEHLISIGRNHKPGPRG